MLMMHDARGSFAAMLMHSVGGFCATAMSEQILMMPGVGDFCAINMSGEEPADAHDAWCRGLCVTTM